MRNRTGAAAKRADKLLGGISVLALAAMAAPEAAQAQAARVLIGEPPCPIVNEAAECTGDLSGGVTSIRGSTSVRGRLESVTIDSTTTITGTGGNSDPGALYLNLPLSSSGLQRITISAGTVIDVAADLRKDLTAVRLVGNDDAILTNLGTVRVLNVFDNGDRLAHTSGIWLSTRSGSAFDLVNQGTVDVTGPYNVSALRLEGNLGNALLERVVNAGTITVTSTRENGSNVFPSGTWGIYALRGDYVENSGSIVVNANPKLGSSFGIYCENCFNTDRDGTGFLNSGTIQATGARAVGASFQFFNIVFTDENGDTPVVGTNTGAIDVTGRSATGIDFGDLQPGGGGREADFSNNGAITVTLDDSYGDPNTAGGGGVGLSVFAREVNFDNSGTIAIAEAPTNSAIFDSGGVGVRIGGQTQTARNTGDITITANAITGIDSFSGDSNASLLSKKVSIYNSGRMTFEGAREATGFYFYTRGNGETDLTLVNEGAISINSNSIVAEAAIPNELGLAGVYLENPVAAFSTDLISDYSFTNRAPIEIHYGSAIDSLNGGLLFDSDIDGEQRTNVTFANSGSILLVGDSMSATNGAYAVGIGARASELDFDDDDPIFNRIDIATSNTGDISILNGAAFAGMPEQRYRSSGIAFAAQEDEEEAIDLRAAIENYSDILVETGTAIRVQGTNVNLNNSGALRAGSAPAGTDYARADGSFVRLDGTVVLQGLNSDSVIEFSNRGDITQTTAGAYGVLIENDGASRLRLAGGTIATNGGAAIKLLGSGPVTIRLDAGAAIDNLDAIDASEATGTIAIDNAGLLRGALNLPVFGSSLVNSGVVELGGSRSAISGDFTQVPGGTLTIAPGGGIDISGDADIAGALTFALDAPDPAAVITVAGNLRLDATLAITDAGAFGDGLYGLFGYGGALTGPGITALTVPDGFITQLQTGVAGQVNLLVGNGNLFWDGTNVDANNRVDGGSGTWNTSASNWTVPDGSVNSAWDNGFAVFQGKSGTVAIAPSGVAASGIQFAVDGYRIEGGILTLTGGTLRVGDGTATGAGFTGTIASTIAGGAGLTKTDLGTLVLTGSNTYAGTTIISGGTLAIASDGALGAAATGLTFDGGTLRTDAALASGRAVRVGAGGGAIAAGSNAVTLSGVLSGTGTLTKTGSGMLTLGGDGTAYTGTLTNSAGGLAISGTVGGNVVHAGTSFDLGGRVGGNVSVNTGTLAQAVSGEIGGNLVTSGTSTSLAGTVAGTATFNGGSNTLTGNIGGDTAVNNAAAFRLDGAIAGDVTVGASAVLSGNGNIGGNLAVAGIIAPGNSIGTLTVAGDAAFDGSSVFDLEIAADGSGDLLAATGAVAIAGGRVRISPLDPDFDFVDESEYTFITADGGVSGTFDGIIENSAFLDFALGYDPNRAFVTVTVIRAFPDVAETFNQRNSSERLAALDLTADSDSLDVYRTILFLDDASARAAFDAASGEIYATQLADQAEAGLSRGRRLLARAGQQSGEGWGLWGGIRGRTGSFDGDGNAADADRGDYGTDLGIDYRAPGNAWALGAQVGWTFHGELDVTGRASRASYDGWELGGYARYGTGRAGPTVSAAVSYGEAGTDVTRAISIGSLARTAQGHADYRTFSLAGEARYGVGATSDGWAFGPLASIHFARTDMVSLAETGAGALNLSGNGASHKRTRYGGGLFAGWQGAQGALDLSAQYVGGSADFAEVALALDGAPGTPRPVRSPAIDAGGALLGASGHLDLGANWTLTAETRALLGGNTDEIAGSVSVGWTF